LSILGRPLRLRIHARHGPAGLADLVPLGRRLADEVSERVLGSLRTAGLTVPCRKGCAACCSYLVPLSLPEVCHLARDLSGLPMGVRRPVLGRFAQAAHRIIQAGPPKVPDKPVQLADGRVTSPAGAVGQWYADLHLECPLLQEDACCLYSDRPISCRQHFAHCSPEFCAGFRPGEGKVVPVPLDVSRCLGLLAAALEGRELEAVILSLAMEWLDGNFHRLERTWPAPELVEHFCRIVREQTPAVELAA